MGRMTQPTVSKHVPWCPNTDSNKNVFSFLENESVGRSSENLSWNHFTLCTATVLGTASINTVLKIQKVKGRGQRITKYKIISYVTKWTYIRTSTINDAAYLCKLRLTVTLSAMPCG